MLKVVGPSLVIACVMSLGAAAGAGAAEVPEPQVRGIAGHQEAGLSVGVGLAAPSPGTAAAPLQYLGGRVLRTNETFAIFWDPGNAFPTGYKDLVAQFLQDVAADSTTNANVY